MILHATTQEDANNDKLNANTAEIACKPLPEIYLNIFNQLGIDNCLSHVLRRNLVPAIQISVLTVYEYR